MPVRCGHDAADPVLASAAAEPGEFLAPANAENSERRHLTAFHIECDQASPFSMGSPAKLTGHPHKASRDQ